MGLRFGTIGDLQNESVKDIYIENSEPCKRRLGLTEKARDHGKDCGPRRNWHASNVSTKLVCHGSKCGKWAHYRASI
ncbi:hypothetical protein TorRG33x02_110500 [Trema orientale]|uniref:Uncharacterized protein n=1 Tax=Trema orientale TaxID=63057 RepID=A0A2P5F5U3_TREOI|nr:hypothetical protein TorRG33x02_110500 [Trema orientale]